MLVSESKGFVFVHVQKTAGTSLARLLAPHALSPNGSRIHRVLSDLNLRPWRETYFRKHAPLRRAQQRLPAQLYARCFKFAFVRNPWDRLVSWYTYVQSTPSHHRHVQVGRMSSFDQFVREFTASERRSQWWMITDASGKPGVDFVGRYENLTDDIAEICHRLNVPGSVLPHHNKSKRQLFRAYYSDASAELVAQRWRQEIDCFGYRFDD